MGLAHQSLVSPCHSFFPFLSFSLCSSFRMTPWGTGALWIHFFAWASKTQSGRHPASSPGRGHPASSPHREGTYSLREQSKFCARSFIGFLCKPRKIKPLSLPFLLSLLPMPSSWGYPWIHWGWTPAIGDGNSKVGRQERPGVTGKFGLRGQNESVQRLTEFCQENTLVIGNTLLQQHKRWLYTWTLPGSQLY